MALGNVFIKDIDGNIPAAGISGGERITGLLFDTSKQSGLFTAGYGLANIDKLNLGDVCYVTSFKSAINDFGIIERVETDSSGENTLNFFHGIPAYHIREFFRMSGNVDTTGRLYVMFADCSANWDAIDTIQKAAGGMINQLGIWTEQPLWGAGSNEDDDYNLNLITTLQGKAEALAEQNQPLSIVLSANPSNLGGGEDTDKQINLNLIPSAICESSRVSVIFGQARNSVINTMQKCNSNNTPVGFLGSVMGTLARAYVQESIAWVQQFNLFDEKFQDIELGFGDINLGTDGEFKSLNMYESLSPVLLDDLDDKGYIFPIKYAGRENGVYISKDKTCSSGDYRTIARNRTINKSRRAVRNVLLPYVNSPLLVDPSTGFLSAAKITEFKNLIEGILSQMQNDMEISGFVVNIDSKQNVLVDDTLRIAYSIIPVGVATAIRVEEGLALNTK